ncbi:sugar kinase [Scopulibacillus cellulosilyticus]|uniref:Sugar kinase n=1 Tax=Scopulibacillus cellulosilyticus TaxID=2665665 RepID=A0ABW2PZQ8_9BACL
MKKQLDIVTFGEAMAMFIAQETAPLEKVNHFKRALAGAETNVAIGLARLGFNAGWVSKVGNDAFGRYICHQLKEEQVDISRVKTDDIHPTGFQIKAKVKKGDPEVQYFRRGSAASHLNPSDINIDYLMSANHLHMTGIPLALSKETRSFAFEVLSIMKSAGKKVSFDPNLRPSLWRSEEEMIQVINKAACQADWVLPGLSEGKKLTGYSDPSQIADFYLKRGSELVVIKVGAEGAYFKTKNQEKVVPGYKVEHVADTVGAGDGFAVGVISGLLEGLSYEEAVKRGNAIGALAVQSPGDSEGLPNRKQLGEFLKDYLKEECFLT